MPSLSEWAKIIYADKDGRLGGQKSQALAELRRRAAGVGQTFAQYIEPTLTMATGMAGQAVGGLAGIGGLALGAGSGRNVDAAANITKNVADWMTYKPRTAGGQKGLEVVGGIGENIAQRVNTAAGIGSGLATYQATGDIEQAANVGKEVYEKGPSQAGGDYVLDKTGSPLLATGAAMIGPVVDAVAGTKLAGKIPGKQFEMGDISGQAFGQKGIFGGIRAKNADLPAQAKAEEMLNSGASRDEVWAETGWFKDVDDSWKFEIDDSQFSLNPDAPQMSEHGFRTAEGSDLFNHPELADNYQNILDNTTVSFNEGLDSQGSLRTLPGSKILGKDDFFSVSVKDAAAKNSNSKVIDHRKKVLADTLKDKDGQIKQFMDDGMNKAEAEAEYLDEVNFWKGSIREAHKQAESGFRPDTKSTLGHELQHTVQDKEGFAQGGNVGQFEDADFTQKLTEPYDKKIFNLMKENPNFAELNRKKNRLYISLIDNYGVKGEKGKVVDWDNVPDKDSAEYFGILDEFESSDVGRAIEDANYERSLILNNENMRSPVQQYERLAGEAEARNVQTRLDWTPEQRRAKPPWQTLDVPENELIVRRGSGVNQSTGGGDYGIQHRPMTVAEGGAELHDLTPSFGEDIYGSNAIQYFGGFMDSAIERETLNIFKQLRGNPNKPVKVYRAVGKDVTDNGINSGDWVTVSKKYAKAHGESALEGDYKIVESTAKASDLVTSADSFVEQGYYPKE